MKHRLFTILAALSLLLFVALGIGQIRSYNTGTTSTFAASGASSA